MAKINAADPDNDPDAEEMTVIDSLGTPGSKYDVVVSTGPNYATRQQEKAESLIQLTQNMPIVGQAAPDLVVKSLDFAGGDEIVARIKKMLPPGLTEDGPMPPPQPNPKDLASAEKDAATARKTIAEAEGQELENIGAGLQLATVLSGLQATVQGMAAQLAQLAGAPPPGAMEPPQPPPMPPPGAMPPGEPVPAPPMMNGADAGGGDMVDLEPIDQSQGAPA
jgi:hypothetical protein